MLGGSAPPIGQDAVLLAGNPRGVGLNRLVSLKAVRWLVLCLYLALIGAVSWAWRDPQWRASLEPHALAQWGRSLLNLPMGPLLILFGYVLAVLMAVPVAVMITVGSLVFGPWPGMAYALSGMVSGAVVTYGMGRFVGAHAVDSWSNTGGRMHALAQGLKRRGLWAIVLIRLVPVAPFVVVNMASGAIRVPFKHYVMGTFLGLMPGTIMISLFTDRLAQAWQSPSAATLGWLAFTVALLVAMAVGLKRWQSARQSSKG
jgi:uncharacterized membrane protein YdjX (TVP38/TMEM64 family)